LENPVILHISDLHHGPFHDAQAPKASVHASEDWRNRTLDALIDCVQEIQPRPNLLCVTGDLTWEGSPPQFEEAVGVLVRIAQELSVDPRIHVATVPGNHDISGPLFEVSPEYELYSYARFCVLLSGGVQTRMAAPSDPEQAFDVRDLTDDFNLVVLGLNSCVGRGRPGKRRGGLGTLQIQRAARLARDVLGRKFETAVKLVLMHHNPVADEEGKAFPGCKSALDDIHNELRPAVILHGHRHTSFDTEIASIRVFGTRSLGVCTRYRPEGEAIGFEIVELPTVSDVSGGHGPQIALRRYRLDFEKHRWLPEVLQGADAHGRVFLTFAQELAPRDLLRYYEMTGTKPGATAVSVLLLDESRERFWLMRSPKLGVWLCPGDTLAPGEMMHVAARRVVLAKVGCGVTLLTPPHDVGDDTPMDAHHHLVPCPVFAVVESQYAAKYGEFPYRCDFYYVGVVSGEPRPTKERPGRWYTYEQLAREAADPATQTTFPSDLPQVISALLRILKGTER
jgi:DNA repair exonuclease SbcCD nuclease subunit/ADP-ribose pyrophosphatase YjhB (NUDIX family)